MGLNNDVSISPAEIESQYALAYEKSQFSSELLNWPSSITINFVRDGTDTHRRLQSFAHHSGNTTDQIAGRVEIAIIGRIGKLRTGNAVLVVSDSLGRAKTGIAE